MISSGTVHAFYFSAKYSSFSRAAEILETTQPNISGQIIKLEKDLDTILFIRKQGRVSLSKEGKKLYLVAEKIVNSYKEFDSVVEYFFEEEPIVIVTQPRLYTKYVAPYLTDELINNNLFHIKTGELTAIKSWLDKEEADIVITEGLFDSHSRYINEGVIDVLKFSWAKKVNEQFDIPCPTLVHSKVWDHWHDLSSALNRNKEFKRKLIIDTPDFAERLIESGVGIGLLPNIMISNNANLEVCHGPTRNNVLGPICLYSKKYSQHKNLKSLVNMFKKESSDSKSLI